MFIYSRIFNIRLAYLLVFSSILLLTQKSEAQSNLEIRYEQKIESKKGFQLSIPKEAKLDSNRSGWNVKGQYEKRVYLLPNAGEINLITYISNAPYPDSTRKLGAYTVKDFDTLTFLGTIYGRFFFHPTRYVKVELVPKNQDMQRYLDDRETLFRSFKWIIPNNIKSINIGATGANATLKGNNINTNQNGYIPYDIFQKKDSILTTINKTFFEYAWRYSN